MLFTTKLIFGLYAIVANQLKPGAGLGFANQHVYSWGDPNIGNGFTSRVANLKQAASKGYFAKVFSWTSASGDAAYVKRLVDEIKVDGIIYGYSGSNYDSGAQAALKVVTTAVNAASGQYYLAMTADNPW
ncbi:hypothetical protein F5883DRAFT_656929 [Diaporthe sp. PMI_573]|nr:hypothetical protein F5883DRAFT_656929 [Diaporthaceae sp. PMI_573]